ncbi:MAG: hypothetical protein U0694_16540 [Anaerolineae bacterium]
MADVKGVVKADVALNVRIGPKVIDEKAPFQLKNGQEILITGFAIDPDGEENKLRYRFELSKKVYWTTARFISVDPLLAKTIPFVPGNPTNPSEELLESMGMDVKDGVEIPYEEAQEIAALLRDFKLAGTWDLDGILSLRTLIEHFHAHGVTLGSVDGGAWGISDLRKLQQAVDGMADGMGAIFEQLFGKRDNAMAFRTMYAPLHITRSGKNNVSPWPEKETWYAKNGNGYEIVLGNKVFFEGTQTTRSNRTLPYTSVELIAHEIGHVINWRYSLKSPKGQVLRPREHYELNLMAKKFTLPSGETVALTMNDGYLMAARSSNGGHETVTDAITCFSLGRLTMDKKGEARRLQVNDMLKRIVSYRIESFSGVEGIRAAILKAGGNTLEGSLQTALDLLKRPNANLDEQITEFKKSTIGLG